MKLLRGVRPGPLRTVLYGPEKVGKTTWAADAPRPAFLGLEDGTRYLDVARIPFVPPKEGLGTLALVKTIVGKFARGEGDLAECDTFVFDTADKLEALLRVEAAGGPGRALEDVGGGFNKGAKRVYEMWHEFIEALEALQRARPVNIILISHAKAATQKNPGGIEWMRWTLDLMDVNAAATRAWADEILFATPEIVGAGNGKRVVGVNSGRRILRTATGLGWVGGSRCGLPDPLPLEFAAFWEARAAALAGVLDARLEEEARGLNEALPEDARLDAQGRSYLEMALAGGPPRVRRFCTWAQEILHDLPPEPEADATPPGLAAPDESVKPKRTRKPPAGPGVQAKQPDPPIADAAPASSSPTPSATSAPSAPPARSTTSGSDAAPSSPGTSASTSSVASQPGTPTGGPECATTPTPTAAPSTPTPTPSSGSTSSPAAPASISPSSTPTGSPSAPGARAGFRPPARKG